MKKLMRKLLAVVAAMTMVMGLAVTANAQTITYSGSDATTDGQITLDNASRGQTYELYRLFDATVGNGNIAYTKDNMPENNYFEYVDGTVNNVKVKDNVDIDALNKAAADTTSANHEAGITFVNWVVAYSTKVGNTVTANADGTITWDKIPYGYYYIKSSLGALVTINSTKPTITVEDKNTKNPAEDTKKVITATKDLNATNETAAAADTQQTTAKIGDTVSYQVTFTATNYNAANVAQTSYNVVDTNSGIKIDKSSIVVTVTPQTAGATAKTLTLTTDYTVSDGTSPMTITIPWAETTGEGDNLKVTSFKYASPATVTITYKGVLTATEGTNSVVVNNNGHKSDTNVETAKFDLKKVDSTDATKTLSGAEFELYDAAGTVGDDGTVTGGNRIYVVQDTNADGTSIAGSYTVTATENDVKIVSGNDGKFTINGLKQGTTYYLQETKAPAGYTLPTARITVTPNVITNLTKVITNTGVITNSKGSELPSTGGMGTTIFYVLGAALVIGAGVVLVTRRRLSR